MIFSVIECANDSCSEGGVKNHIGTSGLSMAAGERRGALCAFLLETNHTLHTRARLETHLHKRRLMLCLCNMNRTAHRTPMYGTAYALSIRDSAGSTALPNQLLAHTAVLLPARLTSTEQRLCV
jgi:hypothetical protein